MSENPTSKKCPKIDLSQYTKKDGTIVSTKERICKSKLKALNSCNNYLTYFCY